MGTSSTAGPRQGLPNSQIATTNGAINTRSSPPQTFKRNVTERNHSVRTKTQTRSPYFSLSLSLPHAHWLNKSPKQEPKLLFLMLSIWLFNPKKIGEDANSESSPIVLFEL